MSELAEHRLAEASARLGVARFGPDDAGALLARLARLEAIAQRAQEALSDTTLVHPSASERAWHDAAEYILGES
jgi:hypothetical protein